MLFKYFCMLGALKIALLLEPREKAPSTFATHVELVHTRRNQREHACFWGQLSIEFSNEQHQQQALLVNNIICCRARLFYHAQHYL